MYFFRNGALSKASAAQAATDANESTRLLQQLWLLFRDNAVLRMSPKLQKRACERPDALAVAFKTLYPSLTPGHTGIFGKQHAIVISNCVISGRIIGYFHLP